MVIRFEGAVSAAQRCDGSKNGTALKVEAASSRRRVVDWCIIKLDMIELIWY